MHDSLDALIASQAALIAALDSNDVLAIEQATKELASIIEKVRDAELTPEASSSRDLDYAMKQSHAARIRINCLSEWTRQKIDRLDQIRGLKPAVSYSNY